MKMKHLKYVSINQENRHLVKKLKDDSSIRKFIHIADNFTEYLFTSDSIFYYFIYYDDKLVGGLHIETVDIVASFSIEIRLEYQRRGIAYQVLNDLKNNKFKLNIAKYYVTVENNNDASLALFKKAGFQKLVSKDSLKTFTYQLNKE